MWYDDAMRSDRLLQGINMLVHRKSTRAVEGVEGVVAVLLAIVATYKHM